MQDFSQRFEIIYNKFCEGAEAKGHRASKLALSKFLGISQGKMQKWESGQVPQPDDLQMLHHIFGFSYAWLITGEGDPYRSEAGESPTKIEALEKEIYALKGQLADAQAELREERSLNRQLTTRLLVEGAADKDATVTTGKAVGQE